jgi:predicted Zn-dependent peptidase
MTRPAVRTIKTFDVPTFEEKKSKKGQRYFHQHTPDLGVLRISLWFAAGLNEQTKPMQAAGTMELLLSGGCGRTEKEIIQYIEHLGASVNTDYSLLGSSLNIRCSSLVATQVLRWVEENIHGAEYPQSEIDNYLPVKMASLERKMQTPSYWSDRIARETYYGASTLIGKFADLEDIEKLSREDFVSFHAKHIQLGKSMLFISGDCSEALLDELLDIHDFYFQEPFELEIPAENILGNAPESVLKHAVKNTSQSSMVLMKHIGSIDENTQFKLTLLNMVLGGYFGSRLMQELREKQGLTYGIGSYFRSTLNGRTWVISGEMNSENSELALKKTVEIMNELKSVCVSEEELDKAKRFFSGQFRSGFDGPFSAAAKYQQTILRNHSSMYYKDTLKSIWNTTADELKQLANNVLDEKTFVKVISGKV